MDKPLFFARKFDPTIDESILDWLDEKISRRDFSNGKFPRFVLLAIDRFISGAFYLQNIYHSTEDLTTLNHALKFLDAYARNRLSDYQEYRRNCFRDDHLHLTQIHLIYQASIFQGYSFLYQFRDGEQVELFIKLNLLTAIRSNQVKRFEVNSINP